MAGKPAVHLHVYTNEDLTRPEILVPEDRARFEPSRQASPPPSATAAAPASPVLPKSGELPLGDVARYYRLLKQIQPTPMGGIFSGLGGEPGLGSPAAPLSRLKAEPPNANAPFQPSLSPAVVPIAAPPGNGAPLGDVARYYRWLREVREAQRQAAAAAAESHLPTMPSSLPEAAPAAVASPANHPAWPDLRQSSQKVELERTARVRVARGDSLWKLAQRHLGSGVKWRELAALNPQIVNPHRLRIGEWVQLPGRSSLPAVAKTIRVRKGDTLWKIAAAEFGAGFAWTCIARANPGLADANFILPTQVLNLPSGCPAASQP